MNGLEILKQYITGDLQHHRGGWCELHTYTVYNVDKVSKEDKEILIDMNWIQIEPHSWKIEWWS